MNLEAIQVFLKQGVNIPVFINMIPVEAGRALLLRESLAGTPIDYELPMYVKGTFMVMARGPDYPTAKAIIDNALKRLTILGRQQMGPLLINYMRPRTRPIQFPTSPGQNVEFAFSVDCNYVGS